MTRNRRPAPFLLLLAFGLAVAAGSAGARAPETSPRPPPRPSDLVAAAPLPVISIIDLPSATIALSAAVRRPQPRPFPPIVAANPSLSSPTELPSAVVGGAVDAVLGTLAVPSPRARPPALAILQPGADGAAPETTVAVAESNARVSSLAPRRSLHPEARPDSAAAGESRLVNAALAIRPAPGTPAPSERRGRLCGIVGIEGDRISRVVGNIRGCGVRDPVRVRAVDGVALSEPAVMDCDTAAALHEWVERGLRPSVGNRGGGVVRLQVAGHYVCRTQNHRRGAKLSEHARGRAIDIRGIVLADGTVIDVRRDWRRRAEGRILKAAHKAACGIFGTTLGPGSDGMHEDHLHYDTARHHNGPYCR